jgi:formylglycine-generating enzyme required for sulfatase activity
MTNTGRAPLVDRIPRMQSAARLAVHVLISLLSCLLLASTLLAEPPARITGKNGHVFIVVPAGSYEVGAKGHERNPLRTVTLKSYAIAEAETTNAQFAAFVEATGYVTDAEKRGTGKVALEGMPDWAWDQIPGAHWRRPFGDKGKSWGELKDHPVTQISGADAAAYCAWLGGRLPTLPEWEIAARAGKTTRYPWGNKYDAKLANTWNGESHFKDTREDGHLYTSPVKSFPPAHGLARTSAWSPDVVAPGGAPPTRAASSTWWISARWTVTVHWRIRDSGWWWMWRSDR